MAQRQLFDLERIDPDAIRRAGVTLRQSGYTEKGVRERLGVPDLSGLRLSAYPYYMARRLRHRNPADVAVALFLLQEEVTEEELAELFDAATRKALREAGILVGAKASRTWRSRVDIHPIGEERLFVTDHRHTQHDPWLSSRVPREPVMYLGADSYYLARATVRRPVRSVLDLCTGSGAHAILAASDAERVVGTDVNPRAVNFARLNAMLNDAWNSVFLEGDLFGPIGNERFELILANPPFVPSPIYELAYRDGGPSGADVLRRIVGSLPDHLEQGGMAHVVTHIAEREGERYLDRLRRWLGGANMHLHATRIGEEDILDYAISQTKRAFGESYPRYSERVMQWVTNMRSQRFKRVLGVVLSFAWNEEAPLPPWTQEDEAKPPHEPFAHELSRLFSAKQRARTMEPEALEACRVGVPDDLLLQERRRPTGEGFVTKDYRVLLKKTLLSPELDVKPLVRDLLERVDNRTTVPELIARVAAETDQELSAIEDRCRRALLVMFERGLVTLDAAGEAAPEPGPRPARALLKGSGATLIEGAEEVERREQGHTMVEADSGEFNIPAPKKKKRHDTPPEA